MIVVYGTEWCGDCKRSRAFLDEQGVKYKYVDIDKVKKATERMMGFNKGSKKVPTIVFEDGSVLVEPSNKVLLKKIS